MAKFASSTPTPVRVEHPIKNKGETVNHEGVDSFSRKAKSDLFLLGVTNFVGENTFYESASDRDSRYVELVHKVTKKDPEWVANFVDYLRNTANMRSVAVVTACEYVKAGGPNGRRVVSTACQRADEPAEVLAYWRNTHGRAIPAAVKRGVADAAQRLYTERNYIKYDSRNSNWRFADVLQLAHVKPVDTKQEILFKTILNDRYDNDEGFPYEALPVLGQYREYNKMDKDIARDSLLKRPEVLKNAGMTWESLSSFGPMDREAWEAVIPSMGYMALIRNLRNFDQAGVSDDVADRIADRLKDKDEVSRSRQLVFRFYNAYKNAPSLRWGSALERALDHATSNIPAFKGRTLVLVDTSGSMTWGSYSRNGSTSPAEVAALVGCALAKSGGDVDLYTFDTSVSKFTFTKGGSVLSETQRMIAGMRGGGTDIPLGLSMWSGHDRVIILSDMQTTHSLHSTGIPAHVPVYGFNLNGYGSTIIDSNKNGYEMGGFTDQTFSMINAIEDSKTGSWPWEK